MKELKQRDRGLKILSSEIDLAVKSVIRRSLLQGDAQRCLENYARPSSCERLLKFASAAFFTDWQFGMQLPWRTLKFIAPLG